MTAGLLHPDPDMFIAASPLQGMPPRGAAYLDSSEELDERCSRSTLGSCFKSDSTRLCLTACDGGEKAAPALLRYAF